MAKTETLYSWLGSADLNSCVTDNMEQPGPLAHGVLSGKYKKVRILSNWPEGREKGYIPWLLSLLKSKGIDYSRIDISLQIIKLKDPTDFTSIYEEVSAVLKRNRREESRTFHLSPGTPAMSSIWIILSSGEFPASLISTSIETGLRDVVIPFHIKADFIAQAFEGLDKEDRKKSFNDIIYSGKAMEAVIKNAGKIASFNVPVLIFGESGTGKELISHAIHKASGRKGRFITVNCGAIPRELVESEFFGYKTGAFTGAVKDHEGYLKQADGGTIFLDEIGELPLDSQVKLLRVLNDRKIRPVGGDKEIPLDIRIVAATNRNLQIEIGTGQFREDLFHRLSVGIIHMPPLRDKKEDLPLLIENFVREINRQFAEESLDEWEDRKLSPEAIEILCRHDWPGNVRELKNTLTRLIIWAEDREISKEEVLPSLLSLESPKESDEEIPFIPSGFSLKDHLDDIKKRWLLAARDQSHGNLSEAARLLGVENYQTLDNWFRKYGIRD